MELWAWVCDTCVFCQQFGLDGTLLDGLHNCAALPRRAGLPSEFAQIVPSTIGNPSFNGETILLYGGLWMPTL